MASYYGDFVVPTMLAQPSDLAAWTGVAAPANATQLLRSATQLVLTVTDADFYDVDIATGMPTDAITLQALQDATCIQAAAWVAIGYDPSSGGVLKTVVETSTKLGTAQIQYADAAYAAVSQVDAINHLVPDAMRRLRLEGLGELNPWVFG